MSEKITVHYQVRNQFGMVKYRRDDINDPVVKEAFANDYYSVVKIETLIRETVLETGNHE